MKTTIALSMIFFLVFSTPLIRQADACTNLIVTKGASKDGSVMITYAADSHVRYGALAFYPAADHPKGAMLDIIHYENGKLTGQIPEVPHTYSVIGLMNEHQVALGETTWGGLKDLHDQPGAFLDYGSLMKIALQRSKTAREAIHVIAELVAEYGYASSGESLSVSDANEAWIMEIIGKGEHEKGAVWVALLVPDGYICGHANQARITTFPFQEKNNWKSKTQTCYHAPDVISFAKEHGFYQGPDADFSFSDVYNPVDFGGARFCDARVWTFFRRHNADIREDANITEYATGRIKHLDHFADGSPNPNHFASNRMPLWVKPDEKVSLEDVMFGMRDHFEGTPLEFDDGIGAGPFHLPYRWRPMTYTIDSTNYCNERSIATQQTGYSFVAQSRGWLPAPIGGIFWFGVDDTDGCVYAPMYCGMTRIPYGYTWGNGSMIKWDPKSAFWAFNLVTNWAYTRYDLIHPEVEQYQQEIESGFIAGIPKVDKEAVALYQRSPEKARAFITDFSVATADQLVEDWTIFFQYLFMKYMDGNVKQTEGRELIDNGNGKGIPPYPSQPGYGKNWERLMMRNTGERYQRISNTE
jgi:dipeptidase